MAGGAPSNYQERLERLFYQATNPCNEREDVNVIKQFCDCVCQHPDGSLIASRLLAHKIQSPQDQECLLALAVLEACVKSCGTDFHAEVGKFRFLNEMVKLVSPKYSGSRTPEHLKLKVIELLYLWTKQIPHEKKILEAYEMLKSQGLISSDPDYVSEAVFHISVSPRRQTELSSEESKRLEKLLQSSNPEDIQAANQLIKGMVKKDEQKMEKVTKRVSLLESVGTNIKLLSELLDNYDAGQSSDERELIAELGDACEKVRPQLYRVASEMEEGDESIGEILMMSDELTKVIDRYRCVIVLNKPDPHPGRVQGAVQGRMQGGAQRQAQGATSFQEELLNIDMPPSYSAAVTPQASHTALEDLLVRRDILQENTNIDLMQPEPETSVDLLSNMAPPCAPENNSISRPSQHVGVGQGLDSLDILGESLMKQSLPSDKEASFDQRRSVKLPMQELIKQKTSSVECEPVNTTKDMTSSLLDEPALETKVEPKVESQELICDEPLVISEELREPKQDATKDIPKNNTTIVDLKSIELSLAEIIPDPSHPPITIQSSEAGVSVGVHFTGNHPQPGVSVLIVTVSNHHPHTITDLELRLSLAPRKHRLCPLSCSTLPALSAFSGPASATAILLVSQGGSPSASINYFLSYSLQGETVSCMDKNILVNIV